MTRTNLAVMDVTDAPIYSVYARIHIRLKWTFPSHLSRSVLGCPFFRTQRLSSHHRLPQSHRFTSHGLRSFPTADGVSAFEAVTIARSSGHCVAGPHGHFTGHRRKPVAQADEITPDIRRFLGAKDIESAALFHLLSDRSGSKHQPVSTTNPLLGRYAPERKRTATLTPERQEA